MLLDQPITDEEVVNILRKKVVVAGIDQQDIDQEQLVSIFQQIHGLKADGRLGEVTKRLAVQPRVCGNPDRMVLDARQKCRWDGQERPLPLTWAVTGTLPGATMPTMVKIGQAAWDLWNKVCGLSVRYTQDATSADIVTDIGKIDRGGGTLAWSHLPCGPDQQLKQLLDTSEVWDYSLGKPERGKVSLLAVWCHENGHAQGLDHGGDGLMQAFYTDEILAPRPGYDTDESVLRYGTAIATPTPTPPTPGAPTPGAKGTFNFIDDNGAHWTGKATRIA